MGDPIRWTWKSNEGIVSTQTKSCSVSCKGDLTSVILMKRAGRTMFNSTFSYCLPQVTAFHPRCIVTPTEFFVCPNVHPPVHYDR